MGSRISTRSFVIPDDEDDFQDDEEGVEDDEEEEEQQNIAMIPMADILNARYHSENVILNIFVVACLIYVLQAKLFYEKDTLKMITTKPILANEQIVRLPLLRPSFSIIFIVEHLRRPTQLRTPT